MHILFLTNEYSKQGFPHGGLGSFVQTIAQALVKKGVQVSVVGLNYDQTCEDITFDGINIIRLPKSNIKGLAWYFNARAIAKAIRILHKRSPVDVIEGSELSFAFLPKMKGIKYIIRLHGGHHFFAEAEQRSIDLWKGFQEKRSFKKADAFIAVSEYVKSHTATYLSYANKPIVVIFNPINSTLFQPQEVGIELNNITFAGTICEKKGVRQLIQAFPLVKAKFPEATLHLYGRDWFFKNGSSYIKMLQEQELPQLGTMGESIVFHGAISNTEIPNVYAKAAICVFPSHMETLGLVAPEAMAMEKAVVFTNLGPGPEVIQHGVTGLLCNPHDPEDIAVKICTVLENPQFAIKMGREARKAVQKQFNVEVIVEENILFYMSVCKLE